LSADDNTERPRELFEDRDELKEKRKELLEETNRIKLMLDTSIENGLFQTYAKKIKQRQ
jgi:hypothetical protein